jgi:hypothetical protein
VVPSTGFTEEKAYLCAINEVYECVAVTGCSRISLEDANLAGIMLLDLEKKQLRSAALGEEPRADDIEGVNVTDKTILLHGTGKRETDRAWSAVISLETGNLTAGVSTPESSLSLLGKCTAKP